MQRFVLSEHHPLKKMRFVNNKVPIYNSEELLKFVALEMGASNNSEKWMA